MSDQMNYEVLDTVLLPWASRHGLHVYTSHRDQDVRSVDIVSPDAKRFQIWLDPPDSDGKTAVHAWDFRRRQVAFDADLRTLSEQLDRAYQQVMDWM